MKKESLRERKRLGEKHVSAFKRKTNSTKRKRQRRPSAAFYGFLEKTRRLRGRKNESSGWLAKNGRRKKMKARKDMMERRRDRREKPDDGVLVSQTVFLSLSSISSIVLGDLS